ncbi:DUF4179 domain-containing protein [Sporosarcina sp. A2]|uniref:DUF4179 domain-containing protein n=1 Tax=Sporosarcina sp. A2 TaxID=3393449 RepID=UPI003D78CE3A
MNDKDDELKRWRETLENHEIPEFDLDKAIHLGVNQVRQQNPLKKKKRFKRPLIAGLAVAVMCLLFVTTIRSSPAFADAISAFPGMKKIVALIQDDQGLKSAIQNKHFQKIGVSDETSGVQITLDGVIPSAQNLVLFYTISYKKNHRSDFLQNVWIRGANGEDLDLASVWHNPSEDYETANTSTNAISVDFIKPISKKDVVVEFDFIGGYGEKETIQLPFTIDSDDVPSYTYAVNQKVIIDEQSLVVQQVTINPVITSVEIEYDPNNTKEIFGIDDLSIKGKWGSKWTPLKNGVTSSTTDDFPNRVTYYLQSSYFTNNKKLSLQIGEVMALDKQEIELVIDTASEEIVKQPKDNRFSNVRVSGGELLIDFEGETDFYDYPVSIDFKDAQKEVHQFEYWSGHPNGEEKTILMMKLPESPIENPITLKINGYPSYLEQDSPSTIVLK